MRDVGPDQCTTEDSGAYRLPDFRARQWQQSELVRDARDRATLHPTLVHALEAAGMQDEGIGVTVLPEKEGDAEAHLTWGEVLQDARRIAGGLHDIGVARGDRVLIVLPTCHDFLTTFFAIQLIGAVPVPAYPPSGFRIEMGVQRLAHIARHSGARTCVTWSAIEPLLGDVAHEARGLQRVISVSSLRRAHVPDFPVDARADDAAFIQYTSGSTGDPKGVLLSHRNLLANIHSMGQALRICEDDVLVGWCPLYHDMGLIGTFLSAIYWRLPLVLLPPTAFLTKPHRWLHAISKYRGTISPAPNFGYALCANRVRSRQLQGLDLSSWRVALNGAEPVTFQAVRDFTSMFAPYGFRANAMFPVYGLAESSLAVSFPEPGAAVKWLTVDREALSRGLVEVVQHEGPNTATLVSCGKAIPGHRLQVLDEQGKPVPDAKVGHVVTEGASIMEGYFRAPEATAQCLKRGWLWTGDLGFVHAGELYICGRAKDLIILRGKNYHAEDLEQCAESVEGVRKGGAVAFGLFDEASGSEAVVLVCETRLQTPAERASLARAVSEAVMEGAGLPVHHVELVDPGSIPKTSSGKRQRKRCREAYLNGTLHPVRETRLRAGLVFVRARAGAVRMSTRRLLSKLPNARRSAG